MTGMTAGDAYRIIKDEEDRRRREEWRRLVNPTAAELLRDFEEQQLRSFVQQMGGAVQGAATVAECLPVAGAPSPVGAVLERQPGAAWTLDQRDQLFVLRHGVKLTGKRLAEIAGCSRQRVTELIGPLRPSGALRDVQAKDGWKPSSDALQKCGVSLQPLQSAAAALRRK